ncbi:hypothetical protein TRFO_39472 [Tritrichomonas foetus]|uniref:Uncharacterized protein n=1 Tax=Tritrichomonas foetus TaxID=1144522 RepID=A0A1J4J4P1_9EUKA|nr:hypothetical protein [Tritrichomonas foetus]OHS94310.1 hypothetical protein TRFO_39472 [Tritrichomonas foetus]|eukprot:OHS94310.1 hypothetical protein TRFO_39472 [Tritrichomonas foetus]
MNNEIERIKEQSKAQLDGVLEELEKVKAVHEKDVLQQKTIVGRIDRVLQSSERYFQTKFSTIDDLIDFYEHPTQPAKVPQQNETTITPIISSSGKNEHIEKKLKHLKAKLRSASHDKSELQAELARTQREAHTLKLNAQQQISDLQSQLNTLTEDHQMNDNTKNQKISSLESQLESAKAELSKVKAQLESHTLSNLTQNQLQLQQPTIAPRENVQVPQLPKPNKKANKPEDVERINQLQNHIDELIEKIKIGDKKKIDVDNQLRDAETKITQQKNQIEKMRTEIATLKSVNESSRSEIETLRNALHTKKEPISIEQIAPSRQNANIVKYQRAIEEQKGKILALNQQNDKLKKQIEKQEKDISDLNEKCDHANAATKKANDDFADYRSKVESKRPVTADDLIPAEAFRCPEFDGLLSSCISKIAGNPSLQPVTKIQTCFKAIAAHFGSQLKDIQTAFDDTMKENQFLSASFNKFIVDLSIAICDQPTTIEDFFKGNGGQQLLEKVADFRVRFDDMKHQSDRFHDIMQYFEESFGLVGQNGEPIQQITDIKNQFAAQCDIIAQKSAKLKKMRRDFRDLIQSSDALKTESSQKIEDLTNAVSKLESQLTALEKTAKALKVENQNLQTDLIDATRRANQNEEDFKEREREIVNKLVKEHNGKVNALTAKYNELSAQYTELVEDFNSQSDEVKNLEEAIDNHKRTIASKDREINDLIRDIKNNGIAALERLEIEKRQLSETYTDAIEQLKEQCEKHRLDVEKMAKVVSENEKLVAIVRSENALLKKEKLKIEQDMKSLSAKVDRERKLMETTYTAKRIQYETEVTSKLNEERTRFEVEKRRICGFAAEAFKMFFDANAAIDEKSYRNVIETATEELTKLTKSDAAVRRIVSARDGQTTEDAVAQVLMSHP